MPSRHIPFIEPCTPLVSFRINLILFWLAGLIEDTTYEEYYSSSYSNLSGIPNLPFTHCTSFPVIHHYADR